MNTKYLLILGAGATLSDAENASKKKKPPLDRGFFSSTEKLSYPEFKTVNKYITDTYIYAPVDEERDSLEGVMATIYADINNPKLEKSAVAAFRNLIRLYSKRIADSTNSLNPTNRFNLYRLIAKLLDESVKPEEICIVTFNQDLQIEKVLQKLQSTKRSRLGTIFDFPHCYLIEDSRNKLSKTPEAFSKFDIGHDAQDKIRVLKLHGSLNWFSKHNTREVAKNVILDTNRKILITRRIRITPDMIFRAKRKQYTFPVIVPPVAHKAGIMHQSILPIWETAEISIKNTQNIIVFGYSCPLADSESANLIMRSVKANKKLRSFSVIDPSPNVVQRYAELTGPGRITYCSSMDSYLRCD
jgi:hypothetical protein